MIYFLKNIYIMLSYSKLQNQKVVVYDKFYRT